MSDDLEFHIQELDRKVEAMLFQEHNGSSSTNLNNPQMQDLDRLNNIVSRDGARQETEDGEHKNTVLKRGSTQATYDGVLGAASKSKQKLLVSKANTEGFKLYSDTKEDGGFKRRFKVLRQI